MAGGAEARSDGSDAYSSGGSEDDADAAEAPSEEEVAAASASDSDRHVTCDELSPMSVMVMQP